MADSPALIDTGRSPHVAVRSVGLAAAQWTSGFWAERVRRCRETMLPHMRRIYVDSAHGHMLANFQVAAGLENGEFRGTWWHDGDLYKWLEAAAALYAQHHEPALDREMDDMIAVIAQAQAGDGYLHTPVQIGHGTQRAGFDRSMPFSGGVARWSSERQHELYNMGHLITAALVHHRATGKGNFLSVALRAADHLVRTFADPSPDQSLLQFNPPQIMGLVELYRHTGERRYLDTACTFVDLRGRSPRGTDQNQNRTPLREESEAVGHAVLATYLYAGAADVVAETGDAALAAALDRIWQDVTLRKLYIHGGVGALHHGESAQRDAVHEAFGAAYHLPNASAYCETCAGIGNLMWNQRMLALTGEARFAEVVELVLYNSLLGSISLAGTEYFYTNPLRRHGADTVLLSNDALVRFGERRAGLCCPPNIIRTIAEADAYCYGVSDGAVWIHQYGGSRLETELADGTPVALTQDTGFPWDGHVAVTVTTPGQFAIRLRIPAWAEGARLSVAGRPPEEAAPGRYLEVARHWQAGDRLELLLPMEARLVEAHPLVEELRNQVAVLRGPVLYCLESPDLPAGTALPEVALPRDAALHPGAPDGTLWDVIPLQGDAVRREQGDWSGRLYRRVAGGSDSRIPIRLIPFFACANRGVAHMTVWMPAA